MKTDIGKKCREYRLALGATLKEIEGNSAVGLLSAFEMGRSSNVIHFLKYMDFALEHGDIEQFIKVVRG